MSISRHLTMPSWRLATISRRLQFVIYQSTCPYLPVYWSSLWLLHCKGLFSNNRLLLISTTFIVLIGHFYCSIKLSFLFTVRQPRLTNAIALSRGRPKVMIRCSTDSVHNRYESRIVLLDLVHSFQAPCHMM